MRQERNAFPLCRSNLQLAAFEFVTYLKTYGHAVVLHRRIVVAGTVE